MEKQDQNEEQKQNSQKLATPTVNQISGTKSIGQYQIGRTLGTGATCKTKLGWDTVNERYVAVKILKDDLPATIKKCV